MSGGVVMYTTNWSLDRAALAQSVERLTRNEKVVSSILTGGSTVISRDIVDTISRDMVDR